MRALWTIAAMVAGTLAGVCLCGDAAAAGRKIVYYGWGIPDTQYVAASWQAMEQLPLDGTAIDVAVDRTAWLAGVTATDNRLGWRVFDRKPLPASSLEGARQDLQRVHWSRFHDNFLPVVPSSGSLGKDFSWLDDARWKTIRENWRQMVALARAGGMRGILFDPEHYGHPLFGHRATSTRSFDQYRDQVRRRGRDLGAIASEVYPGMVVLGLFGHSLARDADSEADLGSDPYGLYPAFLDGLVEGGRRIKFVDGFEFSYGYRTRAEFVAGRERVTERLRTLSQLPAEQRRRVTVGFGLWLDNGGSARWSTGQTVRNHFTPDGFREALTQALELSDGYVWLYAEAPRFFPVRELPEAYLDAIRAARENAARS